MKILKYLLPNSSKIQNELGWEVQYQLDDMLAHSWNWQKNNPNGYESA